MLYKLLESMFTDNMNNKLYPIYCDFDGTITKKDAVNTFFELYASPKWVESENLWLQGKITSRENAIKQVALISEVTEKELDDYIENIEINEGFIDFVNFAENNNIKITILSDGFDLFIQKTLQKLNITNIDFYANHLIYDNNKFKIKFPHYNANCQIGAGMCKCSKVKEKKFCYIGDGTSDLCIAQKADLLFASKSLKQYCEKNAINHYSFQDFTDIINKLKKISEDT